MTADAAAIVRSHGADCDCTKCVGFQPDHELSMTHGSYASAVRLAKDPRTIAIATVVRDSVPAYAPSDEVTIELLAVALRRVERGAQAIEEADEAAGDRAGAMYAESQKWLASLRADLRGWIRTAAKLSDSLGLNPLSRSKLAVNVSTGSLMRAELLERYGGER